ncbi:oxidoreductase [Rhizobium wenxiniae]|uniref:Putative dehydrogenase n=1 Tax=Rhizobium wenxiniae TaxID=1737357 RepID=A0A7X0D0N0_9HYPH|nr:Gfo/Idh/MocA family oxidoreductase [Rhizobium wenxiniae]MBB6163539.1 putative dehydrogenase [Rhizobium wenxiniae]GGG07962.1 oxidoreductase [Rhizobium wenxiniae]
MPAEVLRFAIMGGGLIGREHAALIAATPGADLVAIADPAPAAKLVASEFGARHYLDYRTMLDEMRPDGVIIALPNALHAQAVIACIERGIPCLVEKPVADTLEAARDLVAAAERADIPVLVGHQRRHSPDIAKAKQLIEEGHLGRLVGVNAMWLADKPEPYFDAAWRRQAGGGPLLINLIHDIDCLRFICGDIAEVMAFTSNSVRGFEVEDSASVSLRFSSGAVGTVLMSDAAVSPYNWDTAAGQALYFPHQPENAYFFSGTKAALALPSMDLWKHETEEGHWQDPLVKRHVTLDGSRAYVNQLAHFMKVVTGDAKPLVSARDGMMTLATILAIVRSGRERRPVNPSDL